MGITPLTSTTGSNGNNTSSTTNGVQGGNTIPTNSTLDFLQQIETEYRAANLLTGNSRTQRLEELRNLVLQRGIGQTPGSGGNGQTTPSLPSDPRLGGVAEAAQIAENILAEGEIASAAAIAGISQNLPSYEDLAALKGESETFLARAKESLASAQSNLALILPDSPIREAAEAYVAQAQAAVDALTQLGQQTYQAAKDAIARVPASAIEIRDGKAFLVPVNGRVAIVGDDGNQNFDFRPDGENISFVRDGQRIYIDTATTTDVVVSLKGGDDVCHADYTHGVHFIMDGGAGKDSLFGTHAADWIIGGDGRDFIYTIGSENPDEIDFIDVIDGGEDEVLSGGIRFVTPAEVIADSLDKVNEGYRNNNRRALTTVNGEQQEQIAPPPPPDPPDNY